MERGPKELRLEMEIWGTNWGTNFRVISNYANWHAEQKSFCFNDKTGYKSLRTQWSFGGCSLLSTPTDTDG